MGLAPQNGILPVLAIGGLMILFVVGMFSALIEIGRLVAFLIWGVEL